MIPLGGLIFIVLSIVSALWAVAELAGFIYDWIEILLEGKDG